MKAAEMTFGDFWMFVFVFVFLSGLVLIFLVQRYKNGVTRVSSAHAALHSANYTQNSKISSELSSLRQSRDITGKGREKIIELR